MAFEFFAQSEEAFAFCLSRDSIPRSLGMVIVGGLIYEFPSISTSQSIQSFIEDCIKMACENLDSFIPMSKADKESFDQIYAFLSMKNMKIPLWN